MSTTTVPRPTVRLVTVADLKVDPTVQRRLNIPRAKTIAASFDPSLLGVLCVSDRGGDGLYVVDGQHRLTALRLAGWEHKKVACNVYTGLSRSDEARWFVGLNDARKPQALDSFRVRLVGEEPIAVDIADVLSDYGLDVGFANEDGMVAAVTALEWVYNGTGTSTSGEPHRDALHLTIGILHAAWGKRRNAYDALLIRAVGNIVHRHLTAGDFEASVLAEKLGRTGSPSSLIGQARSYRDLYGGNMTTALTDVLIGVYNKGRRKNTLPEWRKRR